MGYRLVIYTNRILAGIPSSRCFFHVGMRGYLSSLLVVAGKAFKLIGPLDRSFLAARSNIRAALMFRASL
jgi:hypothetical protein